MLLVQDISNNFWIVIHFITYKDCVVFCVNALDIFGFVPILWHACYTLLQTINLQCCGFIIVVIYRWYYRRQVNPTL